MDNDPKVKYYSDEQVSDTLKKGFRLEPLFREDIENGFTVMLVSKPFNAQPVLMNVFTTVEELRAADERREKMREHFKQKYGVDLG